MLRGFFAMLPSLLLIWAFAAKADTKAENAEAAVPRPALEAALQSENYLASRRLLMAVIEKPSPKEKTKARDWSRALLALISLERLMGEESEAKKLFARCGRACAEVVEASEWQAIRKWACRNSQASACGISAP